MPVTAVVSNHFKYQLAKKQIDMDADTFKLILMADGFVFDKDNHAVLADVSASELAAGYGYTGAIALTNSTVTENDSTDKATTTFDDITLTASGGAIGPTPGAIVYDESTSDDTIVGFIDFGADITSTDGQTMLVKGIEINVA